MIDPDTDKYDTDQLTIKWCYLLMAIFGVFVWGFMFLYTNKLDKSVFDEHQKSIAMMSEDIRAIRALIDQHAIRQIPPSQ